MLIKSEVKSKISDQVSVCLPFIWTHPPVEDPYRSVAETGNDERTLGVTGQAGYTAVRSCRDVLVDTHGNSPVKTCKETCHKVP